MYRDDWHPLRMLLLECPSQQTSEPFYYGAAYDKRDQADPYEVSTGRMIGVGGSPGGLFAQ
jgi:hypothetical protein